MERAIAEGLGLECARAGNDLLAAVNRDPRAAEETGGDDEILETVVVDIAEGGAGSPAEARIVDPEEPDDLGRVAGGPPGELLQLLLAQKGPVQYAVPTAA